jgi:hypothetical protein
MNKSFRFRFGLLQVCFLAFLFFGFAQVGLGQGDYWEELKTPPGGTAEVVQVASGLVYATTPDSSLYISSDNGVHWEVVLPPLEVRGTIHRKITVGLKGALFVEEWAFIPDSGLYIKIYRSDDNGTSWSVFKDNLRFKFMRQSKNGNLYAVVDTFVANFNLSLLYQDPYVLKSTDNGNSWVNIHDFPNYEFPYITNFDVNDLDLISFRISSEFFYSNNDGITWNKAFNPTSGTALYNNTETFFGNINSLIWRHEANSDTFDIVRFDSLFGVSYVGTLSRNIEGHIFAPTDKGIYKSIDDGLSWYLWNDQYTWAGFASKMPLSDGTFMVNSSEALTRLPLNQNKLTFSGYGINKGIIKDLVFKNNQEWFASTYLGLWKSIDEGVNWTLLQQTDEKGYGNYANVLDSSGIFILIKKDSLTISQDWGQTFNNVPIPDPAWFNTGLGFNSNTGSIFYSTDDGTIRSNDWGNSWQLVGDSIYIINLKKHPSGALIGSFISTFNQPSGGFAPFLYKSVDDGLSWQLIFDIAYSISVDISPDGDLLTYALADLWESKNLGLTWEKKSGLNFNYFPNLFRLQNQLFSITYDKIYQSVNGGTTWQTIPSVGLGANDEFISFDKSNRLYFVNYSYNSSNGNLYRSKNSVLNGAYLHGNLHKDLDANCDTPEPADSLANWIVQAEGNNTWYTNSDSAGNYIFFIDTGSYQLTLRPKLNLFWDICEDSVTVVLPAFLDSVQQDFKVLALADCPFMGVDLAVPYLERCFPSSAYVSYCNYGTVNADSVWIDLLLDPALSMVSSPIPYDSLGGNRYRFPVGSVPFGECGDFQFTVLTDCDSTVLGQTHCFMAHIYPDSMCVPVPGWSGAEIQVTASCDADSNVQFKISNPKPVGTQTLEYVIVEDDVVLFQGQGQYGPGEIKTITATTAATGHFYRLESKQEPNHPFSRQVSAWVEGCGGFTSLGFVNQYFIDNGIVSQDVECVPNTGSFDPNDKQGFPLGYDSKHYIDRGTDLEYLIRFQNTGTSAAHFVVIRDTLSTNLDAGSLRMGAASHPYTWTIDGQGFLTIRFDDINLPDSTSNLLGSQGFISFHIAQKPNLDLQTKIFNRAYIYFDYNGAVQTNRTLHTIGENFITITADKSPEIPELLVSVAPNPMGETAVIRFEGLKSVGNRFTLSDAQGKTVRSEDFDGGLLVFERRGLGSGVYFFRILGRNGDLLGSGKIMVNE